MALASTHFISPIGKEFKFYYRDGTSDERVLTEVVHKRCYAKRKIRFDVERGERWLDLGANIGAFALYCHLREALAVCYEPEPACFDILGKNILEIQSTMLEGKKRFRVIKRAVIGSDFYDTGVPMWRHSNPDTHSRASTFPLRGGQPFSCPAAYSGNLEDAHGAFDGIKMDIEGAEGQIIDNWALPNCNKLVLEYHTSRDPKIKHLRQRLEALKDHFKIVSYPPELDRLCDSGYDESKTFFDRMIFCKDPIRKW